MPSKTTTLLGLLAGLATASADIYMVHFADTDDNVEMVTVFNNGCIKAAEGRYARYHCDESAGALAVAYYGDDSCMMSSDGEMKSTLIFSNEWAAAYTDAETGLSYNKRAALYCNAQSMSESNEDMSWKSQSNGGVVMHYFSDGDDTMTCATQPTVSQYLVQDHCMQYAASSGIVVSRSPNGQAELTEHSRSNGRRSMLNGERIFAVFNAGEESNTISADFFSNGFCMDNEVIIGDDDGEDIGLPASDSTMLRGRSLTTRSEAQSKRAVENRRLQAVQDQSTVTQYKELYNLEMLAGTCSNRNLFLLTGIFTEHHVLAAHVSAYKIDQLTNEAFTSYDSSSWASGIGFSVLGFLMLGVVIGVAIAMALYRFGVVNVQTITPDEYGKLNMDSQHSVTTSPVSFRGLLTESPPTSPDDHIEMNNQYDALPADSTHSNVTKMLGLESPTVEDTKSSVENDVENTFPLHAPQVAPSVSADSTDEMLPQRGLQFTQKVLQ